MSQRVEVTFQVEGRMDGPLAQDIIDQGLSSEQMANLFATDLKKLLLDEMDGGVGSGVLTQVNVRAVARLHDDDEGIGHAEA